MTTPKVRATPSPPPRGGARKLGAARRFLAIRRSIGVLSRSPHAALAGLLVAYVAAVGCFVPEMWTLETAHDVLVAMLPLAIVAIGQGFVLKVGQIDLSVTAAMSCASVIAAWLMTTSGGPLAGSSWAMPAGLLCFIVGGAVVGAFNGICTVLLRMPSFLVSLATGMFLAGAALWFVAKVAEAASIGDLPPRFVQIGYGDIGGVPIALIVALLLALAAQWLFTRSLAGHWMRAVGLNAETARVSGVPVARVVIGAFLLSGLYAGIAAAIYSARLETGTPLLAERSLLLDIIGAAVIGGVSLFGGRGSVAGVLMGVLLLTVLDKGLQLLGLSLFIVLATKGGVILLAALLDGWRRPEITPYGLRPPPSGGATGGPAEPDPRWPLEVRGECALECTAAPSNAETSSIAPILRARDLSKSFFGTAVLHGIDIDARAGEVLALVGENGSGKSTTLNLLAGVLQRDGGSVQLGGIDFEPRSPRQAEAAGLAFIQQELNVFANLSIEDNLFIGHYPRHLGWLPTIARRRLRAKAEGLMALVGLALPPGTLASALSPGERQLVEIARALAIDARVILFDEPTTSLTAPECERLFALIERLRAQGLCIVYVSHVLGDVFRLADHITVLRDGRVAASGKRGETTPQQVITAMVGRAIDALYPARQRSVAAPPKPLLDVRGLGCHGVVEDLSFTLAAGEILGVAGLMGSGRTEMARMLFGLDAFDRGSVSIDSQPLRSGNPRERIAAGIAFLTEDRQHEGLLLDADVGDNLGLAALPRFAHGPVSALDRPATRHAAQAMAATVDIRTSTPDTLAAIARTLSGGNQQKLVLGKWLLRQPRLLILDEPTRGVDVGARAELYRLIVQLADAGLAVLLISSELEELIGLADRLIVLRRGRIGGRFERDHFDREAILAAAMWERAA